MFQLFIFLNTRTLQTDQILGSDPHLYFGEK